MRAHESESIAISGIRSFFALHPEIQVAESALALSGGRDSSLLARLLVDLGMAPALSIYVNHRLRSNSELEAEICIIEKICGNLGIPLSILDIGPGSIERLARFQGIGIEAAARRLRYQALVEETKKKGLKAILTGHHQDDQLETLFLRLMRSSGSKGLGCMRAVRQIGPGIKLARPLLGVASRDIEAAASALALEYSTDSSNRLARYDRNRIRFSLMPLLDESFPGWRQGALGSMARLAEEGDFLEESCKAIARGGREAFLSSSPFMRSEILARAFAASGSRAEPRRKAMFQAAESLARGAERAVLFDRVLSLGPDGLRLAPTLDSPRECGYFFTLESAGIYRAGPVSLEAEWTEERDSPSPGFSDLDSASFAFPLVLRSRVPGDKIWDGRSSLSVDEIVKSWGLEAKDRMVLPVAEDAKGIVAILPAALSGLEGMRPRYRHFPGKLSGKALRIRIKGDSAFDVR